MPNDGFSYPNDGPCPSLVEMAQFAEEKIKRLEKELKDAREFIRTLQ